MILRLVAAGALLALGAFFTLFALAALRGAVLSLIEHAWFDAALLALFGVGVVVVTARAARALTAIGGRRGG